MPKQDPSAKKNEDTVDDEHTLDHIKKTRKESIVPCVTNESDIMSPVMPRPRHTMEDLNEVQEQKEVERPKKAPIIMRMRYDIWLKLQYFERYEFKFALKMAVAVLVLCIPAYTPASMEWYNGVRGQWSALTVIAIMNPTRLEESLYYIHILTIIM